MRKTWAALVAAAMVAAPLVGIAAAAPPAAALDNGLAAAPPMGWNDWNAFGCDVSAKLIEQTADKIVSSGMAAAGYKYVSVDDCWMSRDRGSEGHLVPDPAKFPDGMKAVADYVHSRGLKFGIYETAGTYTCAGYPGSLGHEATDAADFAAWGVDYLKYDNCNNENLPAQPRYTAMRDALQATGRPILFSLCSWGQESVWSWGGTVGNTWRTTLDIHPTFSSMLSIFHQNVGLARFAGPGGWNDPDMLEVGNGMTQTEDRSEFSLWAEMAAPLLSGTDLRAASAQTLSIYTNKDVIAVDQDPLGKQGTEVSSAGGLDVLAKPLADGSVAVTLFNENATPALISASAADVGLPDASAYTLRDLWSKQSTVSAGAISASVPGHGTVMYRVSPARHASATTPSTTVDTQAPATATAGEPFRVVSTFTNNGTRPVTKVRLGLDLPTSWRAKPLTDTAFSQVRPGHEATAAFSVTAPNSTSEPIESAEITGTASASWSGATVRAASAPVTERLAGSLASPWKAFANTGALTGQSGTALGIYGAGADTYGSTDQYGAIYQSGAEHDGSTTIVRVTQQANTSSWAKAGIMVRNDITLPGASAGYVVLIASPGNGYALQWDSNGDGQLDSNTNVVLSGGPGFGTTAYPAWLKLVRSGDTYSGYYSLDGTTWKLVGTGTAPGAAAAQDVGVYTTSGDANAPGEADFDGFTQN